MAGIKNFVSTLYSPEDSTVLCSGRFGNQKLASIQFTDDDVLLAAEILIAVNDADNFSSKADILERAMSYGWTPSSLESAIA